MTPLDSRYTQVGFNLISVQVCPGFFEHYCTGVHSSNMPDTYSDIQFLTFIPGKCNVQYTLATTTTPSSFIVGALIAGAETSSCTVSAAYIPRQVIRLKPPGEGIFLHSIWSVMFTVELPLFLPRRHHAVDFSLMNHEPRNSNCYCGFH